MYYFLWLKNILLKRVPLVIFKERGKSWTLNSIGKYCHSLCQVLRKKVSNHCYACPPSRQPAHPRGAAPQQQSQPEASPQEPDEPEEILGSDDEEQEDPNDYCKGEGMTAARVRGVTMMKCPS